MKNIFLAFLFISTSLLAQNYDKKWTKVIAYENAGKIKSANSVVEKIHKKAVKNANEEQIIKCFFYKSKYMLVLEENAQSQILINLKSEIGKASIPSKALLNLVYAKCLKEYFNANRYRLYNRTESDSITRSNFLVWTEGDFEKEIDNAYEQTLGNENVLKTTSLKNYETIFDYTSSEKFNNQTVFEYLLNENIAHYGSRISYFQDLDEYKNILLGDSESFRKSDLDFVKDNNLKKVLRFRQQLEEGNSLEYQFERILFCHTHFIRSVDEYQKALDSLQKKNTDNLLLQKILNEKAFVFRQYASKEFNSDYLKKAVAELDSVINIKNESNAYILALNQKRQILSKRLSIELQKFTYANENTRAQINYRNIEDVKISFYKINQKNIDEFELNYQKRDSLCSDFITRNKVYKSLSQPLVDKKDYFDYTTEILLPQLEIGRYLVYFESSNPEVKEKAFDFEIITVSDMMVLANRKDKSEFYQVLNRKTGKPIENANLKSNSFEIKTYKDGIASHYSKDNYNYRSENLRLTYKNDTISLNNSYINTDFLYDRGEEEFKIKVQFYLDRAIYRPGQTVYYKGIAFQKKSGKTNIIPKLLVKIIVENPSGDEFKTFEITTNEFGSFSGELVLPNNGLTGNCSIRAEEPGDSENDPLYDKIKDEHPIWDNYDDLEDSEISFNVEEYKRPKFEVTFEKIKEDLVINQNIAIKGNAKAFAGSTISDAKVTYTVERQTYNSYRSRYPENSKTIATGETKTDASGKFIIEFNAKSDDDAKKEDLPTFGYIIKANVTDINGETRSKVTTVRAGYHSLVLTANIPKIINVKDSNEIQIASKNLNNEPSITKGEVKIYFIREYSKKFKKRVFKNPEIETISDLEFEKLFPYEDNERPISENDKGQLVFSKNVDTNLDKVIPLNFIQNYKSGYYKLVFSASDKQNNFIETNTDFEISQNSNKPQGDKLFTIVQLNENPKKDGFIHLKLTSEIPELYINTTGNYRDDLFFEQNIELKNHEAIIKIPLHNEFENLVKIGFQSIFENQNFSQEYETILKVPEQKLELETETFRSKIEPGSTESWSFKLKQKNTSAESEILASMYDSSLDQFVVRNWQTLSFNKGYYDNDVNYKTAIGFDKANVFVKNLNPIITTTPELNDEETADLIWFGFNFNNYNNLGDAIKYKKALSKKSVKPLNSKKVYGTITDANGPLPGVNVVVKGTQRGVSSNFDGTYEIEAAEGESLVFSFMGLNDVVKTIGLSKEMNVVMQEDSRVLEAVVVTAMGIKKNSDVTTLSFQKEKTKEIINTFAGKVTGLLINDSNDGFVSDSSKIVLRGARNMSGNAEALIVIDGAISSSSALKLLSPDDILSVQVLKGAEGAALFGSDGVNGVIIITTQKAMQELSQVKARKNLSETAFFLPHLKADKTGKVSFNFTSPEALTEWKLRLFAHNKNAVSGYLQKSVITQKDLMVTPNFPRFLREKDSIQIVTKVANVTGTAKTGIAVLQFFDAATMEPIDQKMMNTDNIKNFNIPAFGNTTVSWKIYVPEGLQGVQYKVLAKSGTFSDGEENILPVLTNNILVTESIPIWVRENSKKEYTFENLKNNNSSTLRNHQFTFEYTSNPTWLAIQSLPYLMEYEHECAEQTFARFYGNTLASEIISSNPKIAAVFETWKKNGKLNSKLEQNEELKSILIAETPWLLDAQNEEEKKKNLALLFDLDKMKNSLDATFEKLKQKQNPSGGFAWFDGGNESEYITRHILAGLGHLSKLNSNEEIEEKVDRMAEKGISFIDTKFLQSHKKRTENLNTKFVWLNPYSDLHYLYTRSFYLAGYPLSEDLKKATPIYIESIQKNWLNYSLYEKGMAALVLNRFGDTITAKKIIESLKETSANNEDWGMYWIANKSGWYWYEAPIETQALLIEAFAEVNQDTKSVDAMKVWLLKNKQTKNWPTTKSTTEAVYALLMQGTDWLSVKDNTVIKIGDQKIVTKKMSENEKEAETGYLKLTWKKKEIKKEMASITVENKSKVPGFGGVYWQYFEDLDKIKTNSDGALSVSKELYIKKNNGKEDELKKITAANPLKIGDLVTVRLTITSKEDLEFIHLKDMRASCFEPIDVLSKYKYEGDLGFYMSTKDTATHLFFDQINKGTYVLEYDIRVNNTGDFSNGITTIQSMYAPEYTSHTKGIRVTAKE